MTTADGGQLGAEPSSGFPASPMQPFGARAPISSAAVNGASFCARLGAHVAPIVG